MSSSSLPGPGTSTGSATRCRGCGARMRPEETWCSLCHRSVLEVEPAAAEAQRPPEAQAAAEPGRPVDPTVLAQADRLIAELAATQARDGRESPLQALQSRFGERSAGLILAGLGGLVLLAVGILGLTLLGLLL